MEIDPEQQQRLGYLLIIIAMVFTLATLITFALHVWQYFVTWSQPRTQSLVLCVVSLVAVWSVLGLVITIVPNIRYVIAIFLDLCESFAIISFMQLIYHYLGGKEQAHWKAEHKTPYRVCICITARPGETFMKVLHVCIYQFAITRPLMATINCILYYQDITQGKGSLLSSPIDLGLTLITFTCLVLAMWSLLQVYRIFRVVLKPYDIGKKFIAIKAYILVHVIQGFLFGFIESRIASESLLSTFVQVEYTLFCVEMFVFALLNKNLFFKISEYYDSDTIQEETAVLERIKLASRSNYARLDERDPLEP